ncbi:MULTISPECIES: hypothetical protein [Exiguobacterium]|uniref:hypothetical protein n=1 Tax=Exiguobacterium TaxID=33986 RepID=UPI0018E566B2|nr:MULTISPECIES: hypothetical protein [Exiguobacterium]QUE87895.1 hypothetical protein KB235_09535 [Exiguobacterium alkaliphilum]
MNQLVLPLDLEVRLQENDIAFAVHDLVEQIPDEAFEPFWMGYTQLDINEEVD